MCAVEMDCDSRQCVGAQKTESRTRAMGRVIIPYSTVLPIRPRVENLENWDKGWGLENNFNTENLLKIIQPNSELLASL